MSEKQEIDKKVDETFARWRATLKSHHWDKEPRVRKLFMLYHQAEAHHEQLSWNALAQRAGFTPEMVEYYGRRAGLQTLSGKGGARYTRPYILPPAESSMLERAARTDLAAEDVLFFTGIKTSAKRIREELHARRAGKVIAGYPLLSHKGITYRLASRAYREIDTDTDAEPKEVIARAGITSLQFKTLEEERDTIAPHIILNLEVLFQRKFTQPYLEESV